MAVSQPGDSAEREAESTARRVVSMPAPSGGVRAQSGVGVHRALARANPPAPAAAPPRTTAPAAASPGPDTEAAIRAELTGGERLPGDVTEFMEPRFRADFSGVRIHTGPRASALANRLGARAFTYGRHVFFNAGQFNPKSPAGMELIAHELTHTIQQSEVVQRDVDTTVSVKSPVMVQRGLISEVLDWIADKAYNIPGFRLFTIIIGVNPINMAKAERSGANILRALVEFLPGGHLIVEALERYGIFEKAGGWMEEQFRTLGMVGSMFRDALMKFLDSLGWSDLFHPGDVWDRAKRIFTEPVDKLISFGKGLVTSILKFIREAILKPLAALAEGTKGYDLLKAVLGEDPVTGEPAPRTPETLIGGFMKLIGEEEIWNNIQKANAIPRAWQWFQKALAGLMGLVRSIPGRFMDTLRSLEIMDLVLPYKAFIKVGKAFASFLGDFFKWAGGTIWDLLTIIFEVLAPEVMPYLRKAQAAFRTIIRNPGRFIGNLVAAGVKGFKQFMGKFLGYLQESVINWLTGSMAGAAIYIPKSLGLIELLKFALSVIGLTYANVRAKLVKATSETVVKALEAGMDLVVTLVKEGPAAAWKQILESISNLKDMVIEQVVSFVSSKIVTVAVTKLLMMLNPVGAFIQAIIAIYDTIMFFVNKLKEIARVVASFIDSIAAIAAGAIAPAADRVEKTLAGMLTLVINFLARFARLGNVSEAVMKVIDKVRKPVDAAMDKVINWIIDQAKKLGHMVKEGAASILEWWKQKLPFTTRSGESHTLEFIGAGEAAEIGVRSDLVSVRNYLDNKFTVPQKKTPEWARANTAEVKFKKQKFEFAKLTKKEKEDRKDLISKGMSELSAALADLPGDAPDEPDYGANTEPGHSGAKSTIEIVSGKPLTSGTKTDKWPTDKKRYPTWVAIQEAGLTDVGDAWVQMHVISKELGGKADLDTNLIPAPKAVNSGPFRSFEHRTLELIASGAAKTTGGTARNRLWVEVSLTGARTLPSNIMGRTGFYFWKGKKSSTKWQKEKTPIFEVSVGIPKPQLSGSRILLLNYTAKTEMIQDFKLSSSLAQKIYFGRPWTAAQFKQEIAPLVSGESAKAKTSIAGGTLGKS